MAIYDMAHLVEIVLKIRTSTLKPAVSLQAIMLEDHLVCSFTLRPCQIHSLYS